MKIKTVFIAHAISGDVVGNLEKVIKICRAIHSTNILPVFPSFTWRQYLGQNEEKTKYLAEIVNEEYFKRGMVDEVWIYGSNLSSGIKKEIDLANSYSIPVISKTKAMKILLQEYLENKRKNLEPGKFFEKTSFATHKTFWVNDLVNGKFWIKPSDIIGDSSNFTDNLGHFLLAFGEHEREVIAYLICRYFKEHGNRWYSVRLKYLRDYIKKNEPDLKEYLKVMLKSGYLELDSNRNVKISNVFVERCAGFRGLNEPERWRVKNVFEK